MSNTISMDKKYRTVSGLKVRLFTTTASDGEYPVVGEIEASIHTWTAEGYYQYSGKSSYDLVEIEPVVIKPWRWYHIDGLAFYYSALTDRGLVLRCVFASGREGYEYVNIETAPLGLVEIPNPFAEDK